MNTNLKNLKIRIKELFPSLDPVELLIVFLILDFLHDRGMIKYK